MSSIAVEVDLHRLHPATFVITLIDISKRFLIPGLLVLIFGFGFFGEVLLMWASIPAFLWALVKFFSLKFGVTDEHLILEEGLINRSVRRIPLKKIISFESRRGLVHRIFNIEDVIVHTSSGGEAEAILSALGPEPVKKLKVRQLAAKMVAGTAQSESDGTAWLCSKADLVGYGLTYNQGYLALFLVLGFLWQADLLSYDWIGRMANPRTYFSDFPLPIAIFLLLAGLLFLWAVLRLFSVIWSLVTFHRFRLDHESHNLHLRFGLLFHRNLNLPTRSLHLLDLEEKWQHRLFHKLTLRAWTASTWGEEGDEDVSELKQFFNSLTLHPFLDRDKAKALITDLTGESDWEQLAWRGLDQRVFRRILIRHALLLIPICSALSFLPWGWLSWPILASFGFWNAHVLVFYTKYAITEKGLWLRTGRLRRKWRMIGHQQIQTVETSESPFDRRKGLAALCVDAPSAPGGCYAFRVPYLLKADAEDARDRLGRLAACPPV